MQANEQHESQNFTWLAVCPKGIEQLLADEISDLGGSIERITHLGVFWQGGVDVAYRFCLWSRLATRLLMKLHESQVDNIDELYQSALAVNWPKVFALNSTFRIDFHGSSRFVNNTQFGAQKIKDAVVDRFREETGNRPNVDKQGAVRIEAQLRKGILALYYNFAGDSLHKRGYRLQPGLAPLKETLAAALLVRAGWPQLAAQGQHLVDPMCGSGTLLMEGAMMAADIAPGLKRQLWGFSAWLGHDEQQWQLALKQAKERAIEGLKNLKSRFYGFDIDATQLDSAQHNCSRSMLAGRIHFERRDVKNLRVSKEVIEAGGLLICNPPYGERLSELPQLAPLYQNLHEAGLKLANWQMAVFTGNTDLARSIRRPLFKQYNINNGPIEAKLFVFNAADERSFAAPSSKIQGAVEAFANRLKKNIKQLEKWAKREEVYCYRLYDADLPEYAVAIDQYEDWLHVQEYVPPKSIDESKAERRLLDILAVLPEVTGIPAEKIVLKRRERQAGKKQYEKQDEQQDRLEVREGQAKFWVNLKDYLDTGLFLDHRPTRLALTELAYKKRFLNLFCYTGTASVHAGLAGAHCTSVDMSRTYLNWAKDNFRLNHLTIDSHDFVQADCVQWLAESTEKYDVIFMDPPSFSNSKRMEDVLDIQRDHVALIHDAMRCLTKDGLLIFSNNLRKFKLDREALADYEIVDMTAKSIPYDFARNVHIHQCFYIKYQA